MDCKRHCNPLIFLDSSIVVGIQIDQALAFIERIHLDVQTRRIDMGSKYVHSLLHRLRAYMEKGDCLFVVLYIDLVSALEALYALKSSVSICFRQGNGPSDAFPFCLSFVKEGLVSFNESVHGHSIEQSFLFGIRNGPEGPSVTPVYT